VDKQYKLKIDLDKENFDNNNEPPIKYKTIQMKKHLKQPETYLVLIDDCLGDSKITGFHSELSNFCTRSRHSNMIMIWTAQAYSKLPSVIRSQSDLSIFLFMSPINDLIYKELSDASNRANLMKLFDHLIKKGPKYGYLVYDKNSIDLNSRDKLIYFHPDIKKFFRFNITKG